MNMTNSFTSRLLREKPPCQEEFQNVCSRKRLTIRRRKNLENLFESLADENSRHEIDEAAVVRLSFERDAMDITLGIRSARHNMRAPQS